MISLLDGLYKSFYKERLVLKAFLPSALDSEKRGCLSVCFPNSQISETVGLWAGGWKVELGRASGGWVCPASIYFAEAFVQRK